MTRRHLAIFILGFLSVLISCNRDKEHKVLILSGSNNHEWQKTTPFLEHLYNETGMFRVEVTDRPDTLNSGRINEFDVIVSNWNSWPQNDVRWPKELEDAIIDFIKKGGGFVTYHASSSAFYNWPEFKNISTAAWIDSTWHGKNSDTRVVVSNQKHRITKDLEDFVIFDELWVNAEKNSSFDVLGFATNDEITKKGVESQPAIMIKELGKGRIFHSILGHDVRAMQNTGFQTLILRGTEWAATGNVKQKLNDKRDVKNQ